MRRMVTECPCCNGKLHISALQCQDCGMELRNTFPISEFDKLNSEQHTFLITFLKNRGNMKSLQEELGISYPTAKKRLDELCITLGLEQPADVSQPTEPLDVSAIKLDRQSRKASQIIKAKLIDQGGCATVYTAKGLPCEIWINSDGESFTSDKLPIKPAYEFRVFDIVVDLMIAQGGSAPKGNGRNFKLGARNCDESTIVGAIALDRGNKIGDSVFDPVFVFAAVLEWAEIAHNERGKLVLTQHYRRSL